MNGENIAETGFNCFVKLFGVIALLAGVLGLPYFIDRSLTDLESSDWPIADGTLDSISVETKDSTGARNVHANAGYMVAVSYQYEVYGQRYTGTRFLRTPSYLTLEEAKRHAENYRVGVVVDVFYDPDDPATCCLIPGAGVHTGFRIFGSLVFLFIGVAICFIPQESWPERLQLILGRPRRRRS